MADITRINGNAPPDLSGSLRPVEPVPAVARRSAKESDQARPSGVESQNGDAPPSKVAAGQIDRQQRPEEITEALEKRLDSILKEVLGQDFLSRRLSIAQDEATGRFVYRVVDVNTGEVVRQYPPEEILKIVAQIREAEGLVLDSEA